MAPAPSSLRKSSHPLFSQGPFDIKKQLSPILLSNSSYGQFPYKSSLVFNKELSLAEISMKLKLQGYSSAQTALLQDKIYYLSGRIIARNIKTAPTLFFDSQLNFPVANSDGYTNSLANKNGCWGYGIVIDKTEVPVTVPGGNSYKNLIVTLKHSDYDNNAKDVVEFKVRYTIAGNRNLGKTFGLFQLGREVLIAGLISGYDIKAYILEVTAVLVSISSSNEQLKNAPPVASSSAARPGRGDKEITFDSDEEDIPIPPPTNVTESQYDDDVTTETAAPPTKKRGRGPAKKAVVEAAVLHSNGSEGRAQGPLV
ncbi:hypothetical protein PCASD_18170 [Puccinia coronata f. sp. avenae]|uniref:Uncharacterized protein n=1 Tax=Puccinia coronata f. sp. avenae TaxID=200324 RepID=A0A2N5TST8_9BASI|nr:hypothetical protein PCASD_18170 [Puccinia coronata f. sp. avenae]